MPAVLTPPVTEAQPARPPRPAGRTPAPWKWSRADYYRLGELGFFSAKRVQLVRGEVVQMSPIGPPHASGVRATQAAVEAAFGTGFHARTQAPLSVLDSEPEPDVAVVVGDWRNYVTAHPTTALLVVEVSDATLDYDLTVKAELYAEAGIPDYWVLDLNGRVLHVLRDPRPVAPGGHTYHSRAALGAADSAAPLAAAGAVRVADLLP